jgi:hypothetical protein
MPAVDAVAESVDGDVAVEFTWQQVVLQMSYCGRRGWNT